MSLGAWALILTIWSGIAFGALLGAVGNGESLLFDAEGFEFVNPIYIYRHCRVNIFGAIFLTILFSFICPLGTVGYWIYKLCTVGRKEDSIDDDF